MSTRDAWSRIIAAAGVIGVVAACGGGSTGGAQPAEKGPIQVGYVLPLTGTLASNGQDEQNGWKLGLKDFGDTVAGRKIQTTFVDAAADPQLGLQKVRELVDKQKIDVLEGPIAGSVDAAVAGYALPLGIPTDDLSLCTYIQLQGYQKYGSGYNSNGNCDQYPIMAADWMARDMRYKHITTIGVDYAFGWNAIGGFAEAFKKAGGTIDKAIWAPLSAADMSPYVSQIPATTDAVYAVVTGAAAARFTKAYSAFGLKSKIPLVGITQLTDYSVMPSEDVDAVLGVHTGAQYCDGINTSANNRFADDYKNAFGKYPSFYAEASYAKVRLLINAVKSLNGATSDHKALAKALKSTPIVAPRGPVKLDADLASPIQNIYICEVRLVNGSPRNVPIKTYANVPPYGTLTKEEWLAHLKRDSAGRPPL